MTGILPARIYSPRYPLDIRSPCRIKSVIISPTMKRDFQLDFFQEESIRLAREGNSVIVSAPTGAGKTVIAEHVIEDCLENRKGVIYTAPIKALSNQKYRDFSSRYPNQTGILTGDVSLNASSPILIMTTEIFRNTLLTDPDRLAHREWVIFDEIHYLDDIDRGTVWEESIILLPPHMKMLALSATLPNISQFVHWLESVHSFPVKAVIEKKRPVPLHLFFQCNNQVFPSMKSLAESGLMNKKSVYRAPDKKEYSHVKANKLSTLMNHLKEKRALPCIYFTFSRRRCEELASKVIGFNLLKENEAALIVRMFDSLVEKFGINNDPCVNDIYPFIKRGIAYHHAGLLPTLKEIIERLFTTGLIKFIFTTETFALGVNMPARTCVFDTLSKYYGRFYHYLKTRDFYQMAGRAGRRNQDKEGYVFVRTHPLAINIPGLQKIIHGAYEPITSQLRSSYATILNLYKIMGEKLIDIYPLTFHCFQSDPREKREARSLMERKLALLKEAGYIVDGRLTEKAELASLVYSFEMQVGELFESGFLETLDEPTLFLIVMALVFEPRKGMQKDKMGKAAKKLHARTNVYLRAIHKKERAFRIYPLSKKFFFQLSDAARAWYEGEDFYSLGKYARVDEGELVRYFRIAIQVMREIQGSEAISPLLKDKLARCLQKINRDVVDAEKQLRQVI